MTDGKKRQELCSLSSSRISTQPYALVIKGPAMPHSVLALRMELTKPPYPPNCSLILGPIPSPQTMEANAEPAMRNTFCLAHAYL